MSNSLTFFPAIDGAPEPIGPYSTAVKAGSLLFLSGQIGISPETGALVQGTIETETSQVLDTIGTILDKHSLSFQNIVMTSIFLTDIGDGKVVNDLYAARFQAEYPARQTVEVAALPAGARIEISVIAHC